MHTAKASEETVRPVEKLAGRWFLVGKTEGRDMVQGELTIESQDPQCKEHQLSFGRTVMYLSPTPSSEVSASHTEFSFEVTDSVSSSPSEASEGTEEDTDGYLYDGEPGAVILYLKEDGSIEGDASTGTGADTDEYCFQFSGRKL